MIYNIDMVDGRERFYSADDVTSEVSRHPLEEVDSFEEHMKKDVEAKRRKTVEEKAEENGYYKAEDGEWHNSRNLQIEGFKLDEEYPDLADKTEELAEKYHVEYGDYLGLKTTIYKNADSLKEASDERLENIFKIAGAIPFRVGSTEELLIEYEPDKLEAISNLLNDYRQALLDQMPNHALDENGANFFPRIAEALVRNYTDKLMEGKFFENLVDYTAKCCLGPDDDYRWQLYLGIESGIMGIAENEDSGALFVDYMEFLKELTENDERLTEYGVKKSSVVTNYVGLHGFKADTIKGFKDVIFPLIEQNDIEARPPIIEAENAFGMGGGTYGIGDYTECFLSSYNPKDINKLMRIYYEIPTSDYEKFGQNRLDAIRLMGTIIGGRDFIHDERPGVNEVLVAIREYYENRNSNDSDKYKNRLIELEEKYNFGVLPNAFNIEAYEKPVGYMPDYNRTLKGDTNETALDILSRLIENTAPAILEAPKTRNAELNELMAEIMPVLNEQTGEVIVDISSVGKAVSKMNEILLQNRGEQGIFPSTVSAIAFLDKMSAYALRSVGGKDLQELPFDLNFKEILRFSQLTSSTEYDENEFEKVYRQIADKFSEAYGDDSVDSSKIAEGYKILNRQILKNMQGLSENYASKAVTARFSDAIWSGNLSDELIGLFDRV